MATRSLIYYTNGNITRGIYCHWDGYPEGVGIMLRKHYNTPEKVLELITCGSISSLGSYIDDRCVMDSEFELIKRDGEYATVIHDESRNMGIFKTFAEGDRIGGIEYTYVFTDGQWFVNKTGERSSSRL